MIKTTENFHDKKCASVTNLVKFECKKYDSNFDHPHQLEKHVVSVHEGKKPLFMKVRNQQNMKNANNAIQI